MKQILTLLHATGAENCNSTDICEQSRVSKFILLLVAVKFENLSKTAFDTIDSFSDIANF